MKKIITTALLAGSLMSIFGATALLANESQTQTIDKKAKTIVHDAKVKAEKLIEEAKVKARIMIEKAKADAAELKKESTKSMKETTAETKALAREAIDKANAKGHELVEKTKSASQMIKQGAQEKYVYSKEAVNESYEKSKDAISDTRIHAAIKYAFLMSSDIHSMKIDVSVNDGIVTLFGKVGSNYEAQKAMQIAFSTKGVWAVKSFFMIER
jgi:osmotically-inducible protein OsmY